MTPTHQKRRENSTLSDYNDIYVPRGKFNPSEDSVSKDNDVREGMLDTVINQRSVTENVKSYWKSVTKTNRSNSDALPSIRNSNDIILNRVIDSQTEQRHYHTNKKITPHRKINPFKPNICSNILLFPTKTTTSSILRKKIEHEIVPNGTKTTLPAQTDNLQHCGINTPNNKYCAIIIHTNSHGLLQPTRQLIYFFSCGHKKTITLNNISLLYQNIQSESSQRQCNTKTYFHCINIHQTPLNQEVVKRHYHNNIMTAQRTTKKDILSFNYSSQSISNQNILLIKPDSAQTHHSRSTSNNESEDDVVSEDITNRVITKGSVKENVKSNWKIVTTNHQYNRNILINIGHSSIEYGNSNQKSRVQEGFQNTHSRNVKAKVDGNRNLIDDSKVIIESIREIKHSIYKLDNVQNQGAQTLSNINQTTYLKVEVTTEMYNKISLFESISNISDTIAQKSILYLIPHSIDVSINISNDININDPILTRGDESNNKRNILKSSLKSSMYNLPSSLVGDNSISKQDFQTKHSVKVIARVDDNRILIEDSFQKNITSTRQVTIIDINLSPFTLLTIDHKQLDQVRAQAVLKQ